MSTLLHLALLGGGLVSFGQVDMPEQPRLRKLSARLEGMALTDTVAPPRAAVSLQSGTGTNNYGDASAPSRQARVRKKRPQPVTPVTPIAPSAPLAASASAPQAAPVVAQASAPAAEKPADQPAVAANTPPDKAEQWLLPAQHLARFPDRARLEYGLYSRGLLLGHGEMNWQRDQDQYRIVTTVRPLLGPRLRYEASGRVDKHGLQPRSFNATRGDEAREFARFDWAAGVLEYGDQETRQAPLQSGAQDWVSLGFELALRGEQPGSGARQVTSGKKIYSFLLKADGETDFDTGSGNIRAVVIRARKDNDLIEFWLAPDFANIPVRITRADNDKRFELRATLIEFNGATVWKQPPPTRQRQP